MLFTSYAGHPVQSGLPSFRNEVALRVEASTNLPGDRLWPWLIRLTQMRRLRSGSASPSAPPFGAVFYRLEQGDQVSYVCHRFVLNDRRPYVTSCPTSV